MSDTKVLFHHIPKTAGTTLISYLEQEYGVDEIYPKGFFGKPARSVRESDVLHQKQRLESFNLIHGHFETVAFSVLHPSYFVFTFLREPYSRFLSLLADWQTKSEESLSQAPEEDRATAIKAREWPLHKFVGSGEWPIYPLFDNGQVRLLSGAMETKQLSEKHLEQAIKFIDSTNFVGITEQFNVSLKLLNQMLERGELGELESLNHSKKDKQKLDTLSFEDRLALYECNKWDIELYRYAVQKLGGTVNSSFSKAKTVKGIARHQKVIPPEQVSITMNQGFSGTGWHVREGLDTGRPWRWTGPSKESSLRFYLTPSKDSEIKIHVVSVIDIKILENVNVYLNGFALKLSFAEEVGEHIIRAPASKRLFFSEEENTIEISVPFTISHFEVQPETQDKRQKGLAVTEISIQPMER